MSVNRHYDERRNVLIVTCEGDVTDEEFIEECRKGADLVFAPADADRLIDLTRLKSVFKSSTLKSVAEGFVKDGKSVETARVAIVTASELGFGSSRQYQSYREVRAPVNMRAFSDLDEARQWLGLPPD